jgi:hypothetical protein
MATRALIGMVKCWQDNCSVPLKSFMIERLAEDSVLSGNSISRACSFYD